MVCLTSGVSQASALQPEEEDYQMVVATCYIRLGRHADAQRVLQHILARTPGNHKALYNFAFCQRAGGQQREAIAGLTQVAGLVLLLLFLAVNLTACLL